MGLDRRALIVGAGFAAAAPKLVKAHSGSLLDLPGDPLSAAGMLAASTWASNEFSENPGCRLVFADGSSYRWMTYGRTFRASLDDPGVPTYAVSIDVITTDERGKRFITSIPVDGAKLAHRHGEKPEQLVQKNYLAKVAAREFADGIKAKLFPALSGSIGMA